MRIAGIILIVLGVIGLAFQGITYSRRRETVRVGPLSASVTQKETFPMPPWVSAVVLVAGVGLVVAAGRKRTA